MKLLFFTLMGSMVLLSSCSTTTNEKVLHDRMFGNTLSALDSEQYYAQIVDDEVLDERIFMNILSALDTGDIAKARKFAETPMLNDATTLPYYVANGHLGAGQKGMIKEMARKILEYMERHKSELKSRPLARPAVFCLQKTLTDPKEVQQLQVLWDYFTAADKK